MIEIFTYRKISNLKCSIKSNGLISFETTETNRQGIVQLFNKQIYINSLYKKNRTLLSECFNK